MSRISSSATSRKIYLLLEVSGGEFGPDLPINLGMIIDCSDSMFIHLVSEGEFTNLARIGLAKEVMKDGIPAWNIDDIHPDRANNYPRRIDFIQRAIVDSSEFLRPTDNFSLIAFASEAVNLIPFRKGADKQDLQRVAGQLEKIKLGDETNIAAGIKLALAEIQKLPNRCANHLILLTDGHSKNVQECYTLLYEVRNSGITLSTIGIGSDFNEEFMIPLAESTNGNAYYIEEPEQLFNAFQSELSIARGIQYLNLEIKIRLPKSIKLQSIYRVLPELGWIDQGPNQGGSYSLFLGNYDPSMPQAILAELIIPPIEEGRFRLAQLLLVWDTPHKGPVRQNKYQEVIIPVTAKNTALVNQHVMNYVEKVSVFKLSLQALEEARNGMNINTAPKMRQAATRLLDMGETSLGNSLRQQADFLDSHGEINPDTIKRLRFETRKLTIHPDT